MSADLNLNLNPLFKHFKPLRDNFNMRTEEPELPIRSLPVLNRKIWGIHKRKMTLIAARPSIGKSSIALQIAYDLAKQGKKIVFLSLEMTAEDILERLFCHEYKIDNQELLKGNFKIYENDFNKFEARMRTIPFSISDCIGRSWTEIDSVINHLSVKPDAIFIDHLNAIRVGRNAKTDIDDYILNMYTLAKTKNIALVICCQINRDNQKDDDKTPQLHELKGSGNLEEMADIIIMLHWPFKYAKKDQTIDRSKYFFIVGKNRNGLTGFVDIYFKPETYSYYDVVKETNDNVEDYNG